MSTKKPDQEQTRNKKKEDETVHLSADELRKISGGAANIPTTPGVTGPNIPKAPVPPTAP